MNAEKIKQPKTNELWPWNGNLPCGSFAVKKTCHYFCGKEKKYLGTGNRKTGLFSSHLPGSQAIYPMCLHPQMRTDKFVEQYNPKNYGGK